MQRFFFTFIALSILVFSGCSSEGEQINRSELRKLIIEATAGDTDANARLQGLLSTRHIGKSDYNQLYIDSLYIGDKHFFSVLLEYFDPSLNLFAIYDSYLNLYLLDKSLNGYLSSEWAEKGDRKFVFVQERFLTKDVLSLDRLSIYEINNESAELIYRSLNRFVKDNEISSQKIEMITKDFILTKLSGLNDQAINNQPDTFYFNLEYKKYLSKWNLFNKYVKQQIKEYSWVTTKPQIPSDMLEDGTIRIRNGFQISLDIGWEETPFYNENILLKKSLIGTKFFNKSLNSSFTILEIPFGEKAENYSPYSFGKANAGDYKIRTTASYEVEDYYYQIWEHSCGEKKFLLLLEYPKAAYIEKKKVFDKIIDSFSIKC